MSEYAPKTHEKAEALLSPGEAEKLITAHAERSPAEIQAEAAAQQEKLETARTTAETIERDDPLAKIQASEAAAANHAPLAPPNQFLKKQTLSRELKAIQRKESAPARTLSRVVHQPAVRATSEVAAKTITRPSGLLGGGIVAFAGTSIYLYLAYHIGFTYQPTVFLVLLLAGFALGLVLELVIRLIVRPKTTV